MRIMVIGASADTSKFGNKAVRAYIRQQHTVLPVNPNEQTIESLTAYPDVTSPPGPIDRAALYLPPEIGITVLQPLADRNDVAEFYINPGAESEALIAEAKRLNLNPIQACAIVDINEMP